MLPTPGFTWGRGNGWMAAGMSEILRAMPVDHPDRPRIMEGYKKMMATLLIHQAEDGMWRQVIDDPEFWKETLIHSHVHLRNDHRGEERLAR